MKSDIGDEHNYVSITYPDISWDILPSYTVCENMKIVLSAKKSLSCVLKASGFSRIRVFLPYCYWQKTALLGELASIRTDRNFLLHKVLRM